MGAAHSYELYDPLPAYYDPDAVAAEPDEGPDPGPVEAFEPRPPVEAVPEEGSSRPSPPAPKGAPAPKKARPSRPRAPTRVSPCGPVPVYDCDRSIRVGRDGTTYRAQACRLPNGATQWRWVPTK